MFINEIQAIVVNVAAARDMGVDRPGMSRGP